MQALVGKDYSVTFELVIGGEFAPFDEGTSSFTIYKNDGTVNSSYEDVVIDTLAGQNQIVLNIPSDVHTVASGKSFEKRHVVLTTKSQGKTHYLKQTYFVTTFLNYSCSPSDVLALIGVRDGEILLEDVDLISAYFKVVDAVGSTTATTALSSGDMKQVQINEAIKIQAALDLIRTIELKALKKVGDDSLSYTRFDGVDFNTIRTNLSNALQVAISTVQSSDITPNTLFTISTPTDAITGA